MEFFRALWNFWGGLTNADKITFMIALETAAAAIAAAFPAELVKAQRKSPLLTHNGPAKWLSSKCLSKSGAARPSPVHSR